MPYRDEELGEACHQCDRPAREACPCCTRFTCARHLDATKRMCGTCDEAYYRYMHREDSSGTFLHVLVLIGVAAIPPVLSVSLLPITLAAIFLGFPVTLWYRKARDRRRFFAEMRTRGRITERSEPVPREEEELARWDARMEERRLDAFQASFDGDAPPEPPT